MIIEKGRKKRNGVALLTSMVVMVVAGIMLVTVVVREVNTRKNISNSSASSHAESLALSGLEWAISAILDGGFQRLKKEVQLPAVNEKVQLDWKTNSDNTLVLESRGTVISPYGVVISKSIKRTFQLKIADGNRSVLILP